MSYLKNTWANGDIITADKLNHAEDGIVEANNNLLTDDMKQKLLLCFQKVAWIDENGQNYYDALENALYPPTNLVSISAVYMQSGDVYPDTSLDDLKEDLVVTALYSDSTTAEVTTYALSGTLTVGTSTITVTYSGKTTSFSVVVSDYGYTWKYDASSGVLLSARTDIVTPTNSGATQTISGDNLNIYIATSPTSKYYRYTLAQTTNTNAKLKAKFKINDMAKNSNTGTAYGFRLQLSNGTNGSVFYQHYDGTTLKLVTYDGNTYTELQSLNFNTWYEIEVERTSSSCSIKLDGTVIHTSSTFAAYYCTDNRIVVQNSGTDQTGHNTDVDIAWIEYYNED